MPRANNSAKDEEQNNNFGAFSVVRMATEKAPYDDDDDESMIGYREKIAFFSNLFLSFA